MLFAWRLLVSCQGAEVTNSYLICHGCGNACIGTGTNEKDSEISSACRRCVALLFSAYIRSIESLSGQNYHDWQPCQAQHGIGRQKWSTNVVFISYPSNADHQDTSKCVGRSDKTLCFGNREAHVRAQDNGKEIRNGICHRRQTARGGSIVVELGLGTWLTRRPRQMPRLWGLFHWPPTSSD